MSGPGSFVQVHGTHGTGISRSFTDLPGSSMGISKALPFDMRYEGPWTVDENAEIANVIGFGIHGEGAGTSYPEVRIPSMM